MHDEHYKENAICLLGLHLVSIHMDQSKGSRLKTREMRFKQNKNSQNYLTCAKFAKVVVWFGQRLFKLKESPGITLEVTVILRINSIYFSFRC